MTNVVDNMVDLVKNIANLGSKNYPQFEDIKSNKQLDLIFFQISDIIPYMDSVRRITHIKSSDDSSDSLSNESDNFSPKKTQKDQKTEDFFAKVHLILNKGKESSKLKNDNRNKMRGNNFDYLEKDDLIDIFDDTNYNEKKFYKNPEKNFRRDKKKVPKHLVPFWDNRTIVNCDKRQNYSYDSNTKPIFVQIKKKQDFHWKENRKSYQNNQNKNQSSLNVLICDCSSPSNNLFQASQAFNLQLKLSENFEIISLESRSKSLINQNQNLYKNEKQNENNLNQNDLISKKSHQKKSHQKKSHQKKSHQKKSFSQKSHQNNSIHKKEHQNNSNQKESHQKDSTQKKSHQKNLNHKNKSLNKNEHQNNSNQKKSIEKNSIHKSSHQNDTNKIEKQKNSEKINNDIQNKVTNKVNQKVKQIKKHKMKDPLIQFEDSIDSSKILETIQTPKQHQNKNELCLYDEEEEEEEEEESENEEQSQYQIYKYRNVKKMKINTKHVLSDEIDPILDKLSSDNENEEERKANKLQVDPIISNDFDQNVQDPNLYFKNHQRKKKFDELCSFDISEVSNKMFHRRRNPVIKNPNEFDIIEYNSDNF